MSATGYAVIGVYHAGESKPSLLSGNGRVIIFDTPQMAIDFLPLLGRGRLTRWSDGGETASWLPLEREGINRASVLTGYDPYNLPPGAPVPSESPIREWRNHVHWMHWYADCGGNLVENSDGTYSNLAIGEEKH
jgi:hypothetical protein